MGSGKTTVLGEASDLLAARRLAHAAIDVDGLANGYVPSQGADKALTYSNLRSIYQNYVVAGVTLFLLAEAVESRADLERLRDVLDRPELVVCRLTAPLATMEGRIRVREPGFLQQRFVNRAAELHQILDAAAVEDFSIANGGDRTVTEVASEMLARAGWL
jgi:hypothetical protein